MARWLVVSIMVAAGSFALVAPAPSYDPWAWLRWGDEILAGELRTLEGPSFKPLPVAVGSLLAPLGAAAPWLWVLLARAAAAVAAVLAYRAGHRLAGGSPWAGWLAAGGVVLTGGYLPLAASGMSEAMVVALALAGAELWHSGRHRRAMGCAVAAALIRVETWPFLLAGAAVAWRRRPQDRLLLAAAAASVPLAWVLPEVVGSGDALRSAARAREPLWSGSAAGAFPAVASLRAAVGLVVWPLWLGVTLAAVRAWRRRDPAARRALAPASVGLAWIALVAAMGQAGFSGEARYAMPGAALVALGGAVGLVAAGRALRRLPGAAVTAAVAVALAAATGPRVEELAGVRRQQAYQWRLQADLAAVVARVGSGPAVLNCGRPYVGPLRGPLLAHHLAVARDLIEPDRSPAGTGVVFRSAFQPGDIPVPDIPAGFRPVAEFGLWQVFAACEPSSVDPDPGRDPPPDQRSGGGQMMLR